MPLFSVIIPLFNKENFIEKTLDSVLKQKFNDFEIIIVDDCSTDNSLDKTINFSDSRIRIIKNKKNQGLSAARNIGIKNSISEYITFIDADDLWKPNFLNEIVELINLFPQAKIFGTNYEEITSDGRQINIIINKTLQKKEKSLILDFFSLNIAQPIYCYTTVAFHKSVFENAGYFDETITFAEDIDFNIRVNLNNTLAYSNKVCASYLLSSENQITSSRISTKVLPNLDKYQQLCTLENGLEKYLDFNRYVFAMHYKTEKNLLKLKETLLKINSKNLTTKQYILLKLPLIAILLVRKLKSLLIRYNIKISSY